MLDRIHHHDKIEARVGKRQGSVEIRQGFDPYAIFGIGKGFTFNNPNATKTCGCGSSFGV